MAEVSISTPYNKKGVRKISVFRPIYYLGCKNSFVSAISKAIDEVDPSGGHACDLFAGSGVVGAALSKIRKVTSVDIQEYSRVLSSALLSPYTLNSQESLAIINDINRAIETSSVNIHLRTLIEYENSCIEQAINGNVTNLVELLEAPPIGANLTNKSGDQGEFARIRYALIERLQNEGAWESATTMMLRHFGGIYFSYQQAAALDGILDFIEQASPPSRDTLKAAALSTASTLVNTVGKQFAQPIRPRNKDGSAKAGVVKLIQRDRTQDTLQVFYGWLIRYGSLRRGAYASVAIRDDYASALSTHGSGFSVVYADPPYTRDHYSRFYHVLETMSLRDDPVVSRVVKKGQLEWSRGYYREERHQSPFCIRSTAPAAFDSLFKLTREHDLGLVLSYSPHEAGDGTHPRVVSTSQITEMANHHYKKVLVSDVDGVTHNKLNRTDLKLKTRESAEIIIKCFR